MLTPLKSFDQVFYDHGIAKSEHADPPSVLIHLDFCDPKIKKSEHVAPLFSEFIEWVLVS